MSDKTSKNIVLMLTRFVLILLITVSSIAVIGFSSNATRYRDLWCEEHSLSSNVKNNSKKILGKVTFGLYKGGKEVNQKLVSLVNEEKLNLAEAQKWSLFVATLILLLLLLELILMWHSKLAITSLISDMLVIAMIILLAGLFCPVITLDASSTTLGVEIIHKHQTKTIVDTVQKLFYSGNFTIGSLIFLFSVLVPIFKVIFSFAALGQSGDTQKNTVNILMLIGKWSMVDVFVIANLLAVFTMNSLDDMTNASIGMGTYFFSGYVILSLFAGIALSIHQSKLMENQHI
jgi:hypothetical protein